MRHPYLLHVHSIVRQQIGADPAGGSKMARELLEAVDVIFMSQSSMIKLNSLSMGRGAAGQAVPLKLVVARGKDYDAVTLTVPKPLAKSMQPCGQCGEIGYLNMEAMELCPDCNGLGYLENL